MPILLKLFFLGVRQASKPMANALKRAAQSSEVFTVVLAATGRTLHRVTLQITRASEGKEQLATVAKLAEKAAIQRGADLLSEGFIYSVAGATVYYEYNMQQREKAEKAEKDAEKERARREEMRKNEERQWDEVCAAQQRAARTPARRGLPCRRGATCRRSFASQHTSTSVVGAQMPVRPSSYPLDRLACTPPSCACALPTQFRHLNQRVTMLQEELLELRRQQQQERASRGGGGWGWMGSSGKGSGS